MGNAKRDNNYIPTLIGVSNADGTTPVTLYVDPTTHRLLVSVAGTSMALDDLTDVVITSGALGDLFYNNGTNWINLAGNTTTTKKFLTQTGDGAASAAPAWGTLVAGDLPTVTVAKGGTNLTTIAAGSILAANSLNTLSAITSVADLKILKNNAGTISWNAVTGTGDSVLGTSPGFTTAANPVSDDGAALGTTSLKWSDLFLASGAVINFNNGDIILTHSSNVLTLAGGTLAMSANKITGLADPTDTQDAATKAYVDQIFVPYTGATHDVDLGSKNIVTTGSIGVTGSRILKGWFTDLESTNMPTVGGTAILTSLTAPQFTTIELGHASDTTISRSAAGVIAVEGVVIPSISSTNTLTNKRITQRVITTTDDSTAVIDVDTTDVYELSAVANATTFSTTGTPTDGQKLIIRFKDAGAAKSLTWDAIFVAIGVTAPTTTVAGKWHYVGATYNSAASKWHIIATGVQS